MSRILISFLLCLLPLTANSVLRIEITESAGVQDAVPIAIVPFAVEVAGLNVDIAQVLEDDLNRSGRFSVLPRDRMPTNPASSTELNFIDWRSTEIEYLVVGSVKTGAGGNLQVQFELIDFLQQERLLKFSTNAQGPADYCCVYQISGNQLRQTGHTIANRVYQEIIGVEGVFDTQLAYITAAGSGKATRFALDLADIDGQNTIRVLEISKPLMSPTWSPDGEQLAYVSFEFPGRTAIIVHLSLIHI